jgi:fucose 4-O-acetylase-like acetyltransferase
MTITAFLEYFLANGVLRFRIPMLFVISGFLFAMHDHRMPYLQRVRQRVRTLLLPIVFWSAFSLLVILLIEQSAFGREVIAATHMLQVDETRLLLSEHTLPEVLMRLFLETPAYQFWFLWSLFFLNLGYPGIKRALEHPLAAKILFAVAAFLWISGMNLLFYGGDGLLFFTLGVWMQKRGFDFDAEPPLMRVSLWALLFVGIAAVKTVLAFHGSAVLGMALEPVLMLLHRAVVLSGLIAAWYTSTSLAQRWMQKRWFAAASDFSFVVYAAHAPLVAFGVEALIRLWGGLPYTRLVGFFVLPVLLIAGSLALGWLLRMLVLGLYSLMTGKRGVTTENSAALYFKTTEASVSGGEVLQPVDVRSWRT